MSTLEQVSEAQSALNDLMQSELPLRNILIQGTVDPTQGSGVAAPEGVFYLNTVSKLRYEKVGPLNTNWQLAGKDASDSGISAHAAEANPHPVYVLGATHTSDINNLQGQIDDLLTGFVWEEVSANFNVVPVDDNVKRYRVNSSSVGIVGLLPPVMTDGHSFIITDQSDNWDTYNFQLEVANGATYTLEGAVDIGGGVFRATFDKPGLTIIGVYDASEDKIFINTFAGAAGGSGILFDPVPKNGNFVITSLNQYSGFFIDTTNNPVQATLDAGVSLVEGETRIAFIDLNSTYGTNAFTFITTPTKVHGDAGGYTSSSNGESVKFVYSGATQGLLIESIV